MTDPTKDKPRVIDYFPNYNYEDDFQAKRNKVIAGAAIVVGGVIFFHAYINASINNERAGQAENAAASHDLRVLKEFDECWSAKNQEIYALAGCADIANSKMQTQPGKDGLSNYVKWAREQKMQQNP